MKYVISGASGLIGSELVRRYEGMHHQVVRLKRMPVSVDADETVAHWLPLEGSVDLEKFENVDVVIHLAGEGIAGERWTDAKKQRIRDSRVIGTKHLCDALAELKQPPLTLICASAIGYYGDRGDEELTEASPPGDSFLARVAKDWEAATQPAAEAGIRVINLRLGMVLAHEGGALAQMLPVFRWGLGGRVGSGRQWWSWVTLAEVVSIIDYIVHNGSIRGPVNVVAPEPVTNRQFTRALGGALGRPTLLPAPAFALRAMFGEMADALLLSSTKVTPDALLDAGYRFRHRNIDDGLKVALREHTQTRREV